MSDWISVKKEIPKPLIEGCFSGEFSDDVLLTDGEDCCVGWYSFNTKSFRANDIDSLGGDVTHWMAIPDLPAK